jgi:hypothetical protein
MIRHCRDYEFDETQKNKPVMEHECRTLCGQDLSPILANNITETLAFWWCPIERITCERCRAERERLEMLGRWPEHEEDQQASSGGFKYL